MSSAVDRVRKNVILDRFCGDRMTYKPEHDFWAFDASLYNDQDKFIGIAKIFSKPGNFGNSPVVEISKPDIDFVYELGLLTHKKPAIIVKFRNKVAYLRLDHLNYRKAEGKKIEVYVIPIGEFKAI